MPRPMGLAALVVGALTGPLAAQTASDSVAIQTFYREWSQAGFRQGPEAYAGFYAADGAVLPPNLAPATGRPAIAEWLRRSQAESPYTIRFEGVTVDEIRFLGPDWVIHRSTLRGQRTPKAGGETTPFQTKYFDLLHRTAEGRWEVAYRMWSDNG